MVPWLEEEDQRAVFPPGQTFPSREAQAEFILGEARERTGLPCGFRVLFYDGGRSVGGPGGFVEGVDLSGGGWGGRGCPWGRMRLRCCCQVRREPPPRNITNKPVKSS